MTSTDQPTPAQDTMTWEGLWELLSADDRATLARRMRCSVQSLWTLRQRGHRKIPLAQLRRLHAVMDRHGLIDGSAVPSVEQLVRLWRARPQDDPATST